MNRITQCLHGHGTVSSAMKHRGRPASGVPGRMLAFMEMRRPVVFWNVTDRCNLSCRHCYGQSGPGEPAGPELTTAEATAMISDLAAMGVPLILFTGGEPLMREDLFQLAGHARSLGMMTALSTNGTLITPETARRIRETGIGYSGISLDGSTPATHDAFRDTPGSFERATAAFGHCRNAGVRCGVRVTLTRENHQELGDLVDLARDLGASRFCLYWLVPSGRGRGVYERLQLGPSEVMAALDLLYEKARETGPGEMEFLTVDAPQDCVHLLASMERDGSPDLADARTLVVSQKGGCSAGDRVADIDPRGNVYPCQFARSPSFHVGNVRERPFSELWNDETNPVLRRFRTHAGVVGGTCRDCTHYGLCGGGCRVRAQVLTGDFLGQDPFCYVSQEVRGPGDREGQGPFLPGRHGGRKPVGY